MKESPNPYEPPRTPIYESWWDKLRKMFRGPESAEILFATGKGAVMLEGIVFFIDPQIPHAVFAASPSTDVSDERLIFIAAQAVRIYPEFLAKYDELEVVLRGRSLVVRIIESYRTLRIALRELPVDMEQFQRNLFSEDEEPDDESEDSV